MFNVGVTGARGRMGQRIIKLAKEEETLNVVLGLEKKGHPDIGKTIDGVIITDSQDEINSCDCLIDFSLPSATIENLEYLLKFKKCAVIGTTGFNKDQLNKINEASKVIPIVFSPNMSVGVNLLFRLIKDAAVTLNGYTAEIEEAHHIHKKDSPSGTAKRIMDVINEQNFNIKVEEIKAIRDGEIIGDHKVVFDSIDDRIEIIHKA
ncbi:MAG: 4-hydroxy-tetrahydrodipicolinate reductase, partial [Candidatus Omnitrophica bacterium]|nr:4-hydroxy-tetrahydrodipicolinate reductase [Candidatus Omnitrophota bacterium]